MWKVKMFLHSVFSVSILHGLVKMNKILALNENLSQKFESKIRVKNLNQKFESKSWVKNFGQKFESEILSLLAQH